MARTTLREELDNPRVVPLQVGAASPYPAMSVVVHKELEEDCLRNKMI